jgi:hypothetical protein
MAAGRQRPGCVRVQARRSLSLLTASRSTLRYSERGEAARIGEEQLVTDPAPSTAETSFVLLVFLGLGLVARRSMKARGAARHAVKQVASQFKAMSYGRSTPPRPVARITTIRSNVCLHSTTPKGSRSPFRNNSCRKILHILARGSARRAARCGSATSLSS